MPVLINNSTGLAEDLDQQTADQAVQSGTHGIPLNDAQGNPVVADADTYQSLISQGHSQPAPDQLQSLLNHAKNQETGEQVKGFLEGAGSAATFGLSTGVEKALGVKGEDILRRQETGAHTAGQIAGLVGSAFVPGLGEMGAANVLTRAGEGAAEAVGLGAEAVKDAGLFSKLGSAAVKGAAENALVAGGDEVSKMLAGDPDQFASTAAIDIGLSAVTGGAIGGAFGAVSPLWKATQESKLGQFLSAVKDKANGLETLPNGQNIGDIIDRSGIVMAPEIKAAISSNPEMRLSFQKVREAMDTKSGPALNAAVDDFHKSLQETTLKALGRTAEDAEAVKGFSSLDAGESLKQSIHKELSAMAEAKGKAFEEIKDRFKDVEVTNARKAAIADSMNAMRNETKLGKFSETETSTLDWFNKALTKVDDASDLMKLRSDIGARTAKDQDWMLGRKMNEVVDDHYERLLTKSIGDEAPELLKKWEDARAEYKPFKQLIDSMNERLHVGSYEGPKSFLNNLSDMKAEDVLRRMTPKKDGAFLDIIQKNFPKTADAVKKAYVDGLLKDSVKGAKGDSLLNMTNLLKTVSDPDRWSPELRKFALSPDRERTLADVKALSEALPGRINPAGTAGTLSQMWEKGSGAALSMISWLTGHNPAAGYLIGKAGKYLTRDVPEATRLAMLKYMGSDGTVSPAGFKAMTDFIHHAQQGEKALDKGVKSVFKAGAQVLPTHYITTDRQREKLDKSVDEIQKNPSALLDVGPDAQKALPEHTAALANTAQRAASVLAQIKPNTAPKSPLDDEREPTKVEKFNYDRALDIAHQPMTILQHVADGSLTSADMGVFNAIYGPLQPRIAQKLMNQVVEMKQKGEPISQGLKQSLSTFMGQPLDSTLTQIGISMAQPTPSAAPQQPMEGSKHHGNMQKIGKMPNQAMTRDQARQSQMVKG